MGRRVFQARSTTCARSLGLEGSTEGEQGGQRGQVRLEPRRPMPMTLSFYDTKGWSEAERNKLVFVRSPLSALRGKSRWRRARVASERPLVTTLPSGHRGSLVGLVAWRRREADEVEACYGSRLKDVTID